MLLFSTPLGQLLSLGIFKLLFRRHDWIKHGSCHPTAREQMLRAQQVCGLSQNPGGLTQIPLQDHQHSLWGM